MPEKPTRMRHIKYAAQMLCCLAVIGVGLAGLHMDTPCSNLVLAIGVACLIDGAGGLTP